jgi:hypothetical protein
MTKNYYVFLCLVVCSFFSSCDEDEKEAIPPVVTIQSPSASTKLNGTVIIAAAATDDSGISSIKVLVDETLLTESAETEVSFDWNTETVADGAHTIKVVATDAVGNEGTETLAVEVFNDKKAPQVTLTSPSTQAFVKSTFKIEGSVVDESALESIKIFIGDALLTTLTNTNSFSFDWDTKTVADGNHTLKITATDDQGNEASVTKEVKVLNYFITLNVVNAEVPSHVAIWYLISRYDGTLIQSRPYVPGENKIRFETPDNFNADERYVFSTFQNTGKFENYLVQTQYYAEAGFSPGESNVSPRYTYSNSSSSDILGYHNMHIANVPAYQHLYMKGVNAWTTSLQSNELVVQMGLYNYNNNNLSPLVSVLRGADEAPRFKNFTGLQIDGTTQTNFDDFVPMVGNKLAALPDATYTYDYVYGVTASNYNETNPVWQFSGFTQPNKAHYLYHPSGAFAEYIFAAQEGGIGENHFFLNVGTQAPSAFLRSDAGISSFTRQNRTLALTTSGTYDMLSLSGATNKIVDGETVVYFWSVQFPDGTNHTITLPQLPAALASYNFPDLASLSFTNASFTDYSGITGYQQVKNFPIANPGVSIYTVSKNLINKTISLPNTGGRMKNDHFEQTLKIMLENNKRMGLSPFYSREKN